MRISIRSLGTRPIRRSFEPSRGSPRTRGFLPHQESAAVWVVGTLTPRTAETWRFARDWLASLGPAASQSPEGWNRNSLHG
jgi:hypothetical protein